MNRVLDRVPQFDARSRQYPIRALLSTTTPRSYTWRCNTWLDQGAEGACVGHAWAHERAARPVERTASSADAFEIYYMAQDLDGQDWTVGTSILAGAKATVEKGWLYEYRWGFGLQDALAAISRHGPVVLGIDWHTGMFDTDDQGFIRPTGTVAGGHAILATAVSVTRRTVTLHNSWGESWGANGKALISWDDLGLLLAADGECCVPVRR